MSSKWRPSTSVLSKRSTKNRLRKRRSAKNASLKKIACDAWKMTVAAALKKNTCVGWKKNDCAELNSKGSNKRLSFSVSDKKQRCKNSKDGRKNSNSSVLSRCRGVRRKRKLIKKGKE